MNVLNKRLVAMVQCFPLTCSFFVVRPKQYGNEHLDVYARAEDIGLNKGNCEKSFPGCPVSIFNFVPTFDADNEDIMVKFDSIQSGSTSKSKLEENMDELFKNGKLTKDFNLIPDLKL